MSRDLKEGGRSHEASWKGMAVAKPGSFVAHLGLWRSGKEVRKLEHRERASEGERGGNGAEREMELDHMDPRGPVSLSDFLLSEVGTIGGSVQRRVMI